jgi:hypothetical protein
MLQHVREETMAETATLLPLDNVEVKHALRIDLDKTISGIPRDE